MLSGWSVDLVSMTLAMIYRVFSTGMINTIQHDSTYNYDLIVPFSPTERVCQPREHPRIFAAMGIISQLCSDGLEICGWHAKLG